MIPLGPFFLSDIQPTPVPFVSGQNSLVECINFSPMLVTMDFGRFGRAWQEPWSKVIYQMQPDQIGPQTLIVTPFIATASPLNIPGQLLQQLQNAPTVLIVNVYQEGEIEWYPPVALQPSSLGLNCLDFINQSITAAGSFTVPTTSIDGVATHGRVYLLGFDVTGNNGSGAAAPMLTITNLVKGQQLTYRFWASTTPAIQPVSIRWPGSIPNAPGLLPTFTFTGGFSSIQLEVNVYFYSI